MYRGCQCNDNPALSFVTRYNASGGIEPSMLRYSYYTAGSGGAGPTILETSFLLAGEECTVYKDGQPFKLPPISNRRDVDFGPGGLGLSVTVQMSDEGCVASLLLCNDVALCVATLVSALNHELMVIWAVCLESLTIRAI